MNYKLIIRPEAELDIQEAFEWYDERNPGLGSKFVRAVDSCLAAIGRNPLAYPLLHREVRRTLVHRFPYGIFYLLETGKNGGKSLKNLQVWTLRGDRAYVITYTAAIDNYDEFVQTAEKMIKSFEIYTP